MRNLYNLSNRAHIATLLLIGAMLLPVSCVDDEYDLSKVDSTVNVGGSITLPIGSTEKIMIGDMLDVDDIDILEQDGDEYKITMDDQIDIEIGKIAGDDGVTIAGVSESEAISTDFTKPTIPSFDFDIESQTIEVTPQNISKVDMGVTSKFDESIDINLSLSSIPAFAGIQITDRQVPISLKSTALGFTFGEGITCPTQVAKIKDIAIGSVATLNLDVEALSSRFTDESFELTVPSIKVTFPEGFVLDGGTNVVEKSDIEYTDGSLGFTFEVTSYDKSIENVNGNITPIDGDVMIELSNSIIVSGETNGESSSSSALVLNVASEIAAKDMTLEVSDITTTIDNVDNLSGEVDIEIPTLIQSVTKVTMDSSANKVNVSIDAITIPDGLIAQGDDIEIIFPADVFTLAANSNLTYRPLSDDYALAIPLSVLLDGSGFETDIEIVEIKFDDDSVVEGEQDNTLKLDPAITMEGTSITMAGDLKLSDFNNFVSTPQSITTEVTTNGLLVQDAEITTSDYVAGAGNISAHITEEVSIPEELVRIDSMHFTEPVYIDIDLTMDLPGINSDLSFEKYSVEFPKFIRFAEDSGVNEDNVLIINDTFKHNGDTRSYTKRMEIKAIDFTDEQYDDMISGEGDNKILSLDEVVKMSGEVKISSSEMSSDAIADTYLGEANVSIGDMTIQSVYGEVKPNISTEQQVIDLSDLADINDGGELMATLSDPVISLDILNTLEIPAEIKSITITTMKGGEEIQTLTTSAPITVAAAENGEAVETEVYISAYDAPEEPVDNIQYIKVDGLKEILMSLPDELLIDFEADVVTEEGKNHCVDLYTDYKFGIEYNINVPLSFEELVIDYTTTIDDLGDTMSDLSDFVSNLALKIQSDNTIPLELEISEVIPYDQYGNQIYGIAPIIKQGESTIAANGTSTIELTLDDNDSGELSNVGALDIHIEARATSTQNGATFKASQYLQLKLSAKIPDGLTIDFNSDEEDENYNNYDYNE